MNNPFRCTPRGTTEPITTDEERALQAVLPQAFAVEATSRALQARVSEIATRHAHHIAMSRPRVPLWRSLLLMAASAASVLLVVLIINWRQVCSAYIMYRMQAAIYNADSLSISTQWYDKEARPMAWRNMFRIHGEWGVEKSKDAGTRLFYTKDGKLSSGYPRTPLTIGVNAQLSSDDKSASGVLLAQSPDSAWVYLFFAPPQIVWQYIAGRPTIRCTFGDSGDSYTKKTFLVDAETYQIIESLVQVKVNRVWRRNSESKFAFVLNYDLTGSSQKQRGLLPIKAQGRVERR